MDGYGINIDLIQNIWDIDRLEFEREGRAGNFDVTVFDEDEALQTILQRQ